MVLILRDYPRLIKEMEFSEEEIKESVNLCNGDKAPGLDGFNMKFMQKFWYVIKDDVIEMFRELHKTGEFLRALNSTFIALIPKRRRLRNLVISGP